MSPREDPKGYYRALGLTKLATPDQLKRAFKTRAQKIHPDVNRSPDATLAFQSLNEAYRILLDPGTKNDYDALCEASAPHYTRAAQKAASSSAPPPPAVNPVKCSICGKVSAQIRFVAYRQVFTFLIMLRNYRTGIFCADCGANEALKASLITWACGWFTIPLAWYFTFRALFSNMLGGDQPALENFRILHAQSTYFRDRGQRELARAIALDAVQFAGRLRTRDRNRHQWLDRAVLEMEDTTRHRGGSPAPMRNKWGFGSESFLRQLGVMLVILLLVGFLFARWRHGYLAP